MLAAALPATIARSGLVKRAAKFWQLQCASDGSVCGARGLDAGANNELKVVA